ncbi:MAG TPA: methyltransferase domain-containing protein [Bacilli bacterium]
MKNGEKNQTEVIRKRYDRIAAMFNMMDGRLMRQWKKEMLAEVTGNVLEVGIGAGANLPHYANHVTLTGIDFSPNMLKFAARKAEELHMQVTLREMDIEHLAFADGTFDYVVATCVFCSVPDPVAGLRELRRVCKPDGKILLLEHMRSENPVTGLLMDALNPLVVRLSGANINRRTLDHIEKAGLTIESNERLMSTIVRRLAVKP